MQPRVNQHACMTLFVNDSRWRWSRVELSHWLVKTGQIENGSAPVCTKHQSGPTTSRLMVHVFWKTSLV